MKSFFEKKVYNIIGNYITNYLVDKDKDARKTMSYIDGKNTIIVLIHSWIDIRLIGFVIFFISNYLIIQSTCIINDEELVDERVGASKKGIKDIEEVSGANKNFVSQK